VSWLIFFRLCQAGLLLLFPCSLILTALARHSTQVMQMKKTTKKSYHYVVLGIIYSPFAIFHFFNFFVGF
jgi:hypothetical protein